MQLLNLRQIFSSLLMVFLLAFSSCTKDGPQGPAGPAGPSGPSGPQGPDGSANIQTFTYPVVHGNWINIGPFWEVNIPVAALTGSNIQNSVIEVYWMQNNFSTPLPFTIGGTDFMFYISVGQIRLDVSVNGSYATSDPSTYGPVTIKVVFVPQQ